LANPGQIVEYIEDGRIVTAVCLEERKGRARALTITQREVHLSPGRMVHVSDSRIPLNQSRHVLAEILSERVSRREELSRDVDVRGLWELLNEEQGEIEPLELAELAFSDEIGDDQVSAVIRAMLADRDPENQGGGKRASDSTRQPVDSRRLEWTQ
jgi:exoribonuclease-2